MTTARRRPDPVEPVQDASPWALVGPVLVILVVLLVTILAPGFLPPA